MPRTRTAAARGARSAAAATAAALLLLPLLPGRAPSAADWPFPRVDPLDRVQLHRNPSRAVPYLPLARPEAPVGESRLVVAPVRTIELEGSPLENVYGNLRPIDVDGDGTYEFVHYNGFRYLQVWNAAGERLWRVRTAAGRLHDMRAATPRDTIAVLDLDGDGKQDIAHCWDRGGQRYLVLRRGSDGRVIRSVPLQGGVEQECQIAAVRTAGTPGGVQLLVAHSIWGPAARGCRRNWIGYWSRTVSFDLQLRKLWERDTCDAGHYAWPVDQDQDGNAEAVFVGKYLLRPDGSLQCSLAGWPADDHVDGLVAADLDLARPGLEAVAVGRTGVAGFDAASCAELWRVPGTVIRDPQHVAVAKLDPAAPTPQVVVDERGTVRRAKTFVLDGSGAVQASMPVVMPMQNANLDGALGVDELVGDFGKVVDGRGAVRLDRSWYWNLKGGKVAETSAGFYPTSYDRWQAFPLVFDQDGDGRDEIVQWGQSLIVVGKAVLPAGPPPTIAVRRASYGGAVARCDPTAAIAARCDGNATCGIYAGNQWCGNPEPGPGKTLAVEYACGSRLRAAAAPQDTRLALSCAAPAPP